MASINGWDRLGNWVSLYTEDDGQPTILCGRGGGLSEAILKSFTADEVIFNAAESRAFLKLHIGQDHLDELLIALAPYRVLPEGMYRLPDSERQEMEAFFTGGVTSRDLPNHDYLPAWTIVYRETSGQGGERLLLRYNNGAMAWVGIDNRGAAMLQEVVQGAAAQDLDVEYALRFSAAEKKRIEEVLVPGGDCMQQLRNLYGRDLIPLKLLREYLMNAGGGVKSWSVYCSGVLEATFAADGSLQRYRLIEKGDAHVALNAPSPQ